MLYQQEEEEKILIKNKKQLYRVIKKINDPDIMNKVNLIDCITKENLTLIEYFLQEKGDGKKRQKNEIKLNCHCLTKL